MGIRRHTSLPHPTTVEATDDQGRLTEIYETLLRSGHQVSVHDGDHSFVASPRHLQALGWCWETTTRAATELEQDISLQFTFSNHFSRYTLQMSGVTRLGRHLFAPPPISVQRMRRRVHRRIDARPLDLVRCRTRQGVFAFPLRTLSAQGLSFCVPVQSGCLLAADELLLETIVCTEEGRQFPVAIELRSVSANRRGETIYGAEVVTQPSKHDAVSPWVGWVQSRLYPSAIPSAGAAPLLWDLFDRAGYFSLSGKEPGDFVAEKPAYLNFHRLTCLRPDIAHTAAIAEDQQIIGTKAFIKPYAETWLNQHMARWRGASAPSRRTLREMYLAAYEPLLLDQRCRWILAMCEGNVRWTKLAHLAFASQHVPAGNAYLQDFRLLEFPAKRDPSSRAGTIRIAETNDEQRAQLQTLLRDSRPKAYLEALDLTPERFELSEVAERWGSAGLQRGRSVLVALEHDLPMAFAVLEYGTPGSNLFHLVDAVRLVPATERPGARLEEAYRELLQRASGFFFERGLNRFVYYCERAPGFHTEGSRDLGSGTMCVFAHAILPEFLEHIWQITSGKTDKHDGPGTNKIHA